MRTIPKGLLWILVAGWAATVWAEGGPSKVPPTLWALHEQHAAHQARQSAQPFRTRDRLARMVGERVIVDAIAEGDVHALEADLLALGMRRVSVFGRVVSGELPLSAVPTLDSLATLRFVRPSVVVRRRPVASRTEAAATREGPVTSEGVRAMRADIAREEFGVTGEGVQVGVLSNSFDCLKGAERDRAAGNLPPVTVIEEIGDCEDGTDEGRAMLQIVHAVAPGASLSFATGDNGMAGLAGNILALRRNGARVIVDDIVDLFEPMFQDGIVTRAVDTVVAQGVAYFSSAGNQARESYESAFRAGPTFEPGAFPSAEDVPRFRGGVAHSFALARGSDHMQRILIKPGDVLKIVLQWDSPFYSVSGKPGSSNDLDVYLLDSTGTQVVAGATSDNVGNDAVEVLAVRNEGPSGSFNLMIVKFQGDPPGLMKYIQFGDEEVRIAEDHTKSSTVFGHNQASGSMAVGAADWRDTPAFDVSPPELESYSSAGPGRILFDASGRRLASPIVRAKPEVVAPDKVSTTVPNFEEFTGTSAAAPHAAGVAALLRQQRPDLPPAAVYEALRSTALDMRTPESDIFAIGSGLIQADAALQAVSTPKITLGLTLNRHTVSPGDPVQITLSATNAGTSGLRDVYLVALVPPGLSATLGCPAGDAVLVAENSQFTSFVTRCAGTAPLQSFPAVAARLPFPSGGAPALRALSFVWPAGLPPGVYTWIVLVTPPDGFKDGKVDPGDIDAIAFDNLQAS